MTTPHYEYSTALTKQPNNAEATQPYANAGGERRRSSVFSIPDDDDLAASADFMPLNVFPEPQHVGGTTAGMANANSVVPPSAKDGAPRTAEEIDQAQAQVQEQIRMVVARQEQLRLLQEKVRREAMVAQMQQQQHPNNTRIQDQQGSLALHSSVTGVGALGSHAPHVNVGRSSSHSPNGGKKRSSSPDLNAEGTKKAKIAKGVAAGVPSLLGRKASEVVDLQNDSTDGTRKHAYTQVVGSTNYRSRTDATHEDKSAGQSPQDYLNASLKSRGLSTATATSFECGYPSQPTVLQRSSYGVAVLHAVQKSDADALSKLLQAGLSPNPCNAHGDSILQMVCKRSNTKLFQTFLDNGAVLEVADSFGRTPLHKAAWAPASDSTFEIVTAMLDRVGTDILRVTDKNGKTPLQHLTVDKWPRWVSYLESKRDTYFQQPEPNGHAEANQPPRRSNFRTGTCRSEGENPDDERSADMEEDLAVVDPPNALSPEVAALVASGKVRPEDARDESTMNVTPEAQGS